MSNDRPRGGRPRSDRPGNRPGSRPGDRQSDARADQPRAASRKPQRTDPAAAASPPSIRPRRPRRPAPAAEPVLAPISEPMRIAKAVARAGLCSRRDAERWIADGRITVNGRIISSPALDVGPDDRILVDNQPLPGPEPLKLWRYHKPRGLVTTHRDPEGRPTVFEKLPPELGRVISVGRLDVTSEGLLLLTNDGALARHMELPSTGWLRRYRVRAHGRITQADLDRLKEGIDVEGVSYGPIEATLDKEQGANVWLTLGLREGKNREVRKVLGALGLDVNRLIRISYGPFQLLDLAPGNVEPVRRRVLAEQLGPRLAREMGLMAEADTDKARRVQNRERVRPGRAGGDTDGDDDT